MSSRLICIIFGLTLSLFANAFSPPKDTAGPVTATLEVPAKVSTVETPVDIKLTLENASDGPIQGTVKFAVVDKWRLTPAEPQTFALEPHGSAQLAVQAIAGNGTYSAIYPVHAYVTFNQSGADLTAHPIAFIETLLPPNAAAGRPWTPVSIPGNANVSLQRIPIFRVVNTVFGETPQVMPVGWTGQDPRTYASVQPEGLVKRGDAREAIQVHPVWREGRAGTTMIEIPVKMPEVTPIRLRFGNALRDTGPNEPASDGVTFRVRTLPNEWAPGAEGQILYEKTTAEKVWQDADVDLSHLAGQTIRLQLESHPGPANNTTCDASYWGGVTLVTGTPVATMLPPAAMPRLLGVLDQAGARWEIHVEPGPRGLFDAQVRMTSGTTVLSFKGFHVQVFGDALEDASGISTLLGVREDQNERGMELTHAFQTWAGIVEIAGMLWIEAGTLRVKFWLKNVPDPQPWQIGTIEDVALGPWSEQVSTIYAGMGNVLRNPEAFSLGFDGHQLASSHVGFDFANKISMVQALDYPPTCLQVNPESKVYTLHGAQDATITLIPGANVWTGAKVWRDVSGRVASGGVQKLAGRFAFDLWGGGYVATRDALQKSFRYGLTDSVVVFHDWQRWGYDYRLPDIYPPNPAYGSPQDFAALAALCKDNGALFAPHDNYIDVYPDADGFSYDKVSFGSDGQPVRAWLNEGRGAQAFRWRPDQIQPSIERNVGLIKQAVAPSAYFIDVWSSMGPHDYWTQDGRFMSRTETRKVWGGSFAWIRNALGDQAPMISESGHDQLIGTLDGAQANHLRVDANPPAKGQWMVWKVAAADAERIPWMDFAWHDRFALHGAGYEARYIAGLDRRAHGIYSDDYMATEVLTGHPAMSDAPFSRNVVRKYWLTHAVMRAVATLRMDNLEFVDNDLHRQHVRWANTGDTWVNRSATDWTVNDRVLPQYGFYMRTPLADGVFAEAAIERRDGLVVEWAKSPESLYVNARPVAAEGIPLTVALDSMQVADRTLTLTLKWDCQATLAAGYTIYVHFTDAAGNILFQADHPAPQPSEAWSGAFTTTAQAVIPDSIAPGTELELNAGVYAPASGVIPRMRGNIDPASNRCRLVKVKFEAGADGKLATAQTAEIPAVEDPSAARQNPEGKPVAINGVTTNGGFRITRDGDTAVLLPLPESTAFSARLTWTSLPWQMPKPENVSALAEDGSVISTVPATWEGEALLLQITPDAFAWRLGTPPAPAPEATPAPASAPEAAPVPEATPAPEVAPVPAPEATPAPEAAPVPAPEAIPAPEAAPAPAPEAAPAPAPSQEVIPASAPAQ